MTKQLVINADYNGIAMTFTGDGWFNATLAAERFGKRPNDWLNLDETKACIPALSDVSNTSQNGIWIPSYAEVGLSRFGENAQVAFKSNSDFLTELNKINQLSLIDSDVKKSHFTFNSVFVEELNKINVIDLVAVTGNNVNQELRNLLKPVQHHTIVGVFLCLSFSNLPVMGELRLALALVRLWWGGRRNKPLGVNTACRSVLAVSNLPAALHLGRIITTPLPFEKV